MKQITTNDCRICLIECDSFASEISSVSEDFYNLTGYQINQDLDAPTKICFDCEANLSKLKEFINVYRKTEEILIQIRNSPIKNENEPECVLFKADPDEAIQGSEELERKKVQCEKCLKKMNPYYLQVHMKRYHADEMKIFQCDLCERCFLTKSNLRRHINNVHLGMKKEMESNESQKLNETQPKLPPKLEKLFCKLCNKEMNYYYLQVHMKRYHSNQTSKYQCDICKRLFTLKDTLKRHIKVVHLDNTVLKRFSCEYCGRMFNFDCNLNKHISSVHHKNYIYQCEICDKKFASKEILKHHALTHVKTCNFECPTCGSKFRSLRHLGYHKRSVHNDKKLPCTVCDKTFKNRKHLQQHKLTHLPNAYQCPVCPKSYSLGATLRVHVKSNHPDYEMPPKGTSLMNVDINKIMNM
uniref:CSON007065 protein n=1 Tax=Culicoides sonorensis TaxID=179676 RepID=A0A336KCP9_CULSO